MEKKERNSNFELLRIFAMILIVVFHIQYHVYGKEGFEYDNVFRMRYFVIQAVMPLGRIGVNIFLLISGYFLGKSKINIVKSIKKLFLQMLFATTILLVSAFIYNNIHASVDEMDTMGYSVNYINGMAWFVGYYIMIIILAKYFLNDYFARLSKERFLTFLAILFALTTIGWLGDLLDGFSSGLRIGVAGIFVYSLGVYIREYNPFAKIRTVVLLLIPVIFYIGLYMSYYNMELKKITDWLMEEDKKPKEEFIYYFDGFRNYNFLTIVLAVVLFELFRRIKIKNNKIINWFASGTFMIYLMHESDVFRRIWLNIDWLEILDKSKKAYAAEYIKQVIITMCIGWITFACYQLFEKYILQGDNFVKKLIWKSESN